MHWASHHEERAIRTDELRSEPLRAPAGSSGGVRFQPTQSPVWIIACTIQSSQSRVYGCTSVGAQLVKCHNWKAQVPRSSSAGPRALVDPAPLFATRGPARED